MRTGVILIAAFLAACASNSEQSAYELADAKAEYADRYLATRRACEAAGGHIHVHNPRVRMKDDDVPPLGTTYYCIK